MSISDAIRRFLLLHPVKHVRLQIEGMHCDECLHAVREALARVPGARIERLEIGAATVAFDDEADVGALVDAVYDAGYEAQEAAL